MGGQTFGNSTKINKDTAFSTLTLTRLKGVNGKLTMMSDLDMSGNNILNANAVQTENLTSSNGIINVLDAELRVESLNSTTVDPIQVRSGMNLSKAGALETLPINGGDGRLATDDPEWLNWNPLQAGDITCNVLNYSLLNPALAGNSIQGTHAIKNTGIQPLAQFYINDATNYVLTGGVGSINYDTFLDPPFFSKIAELTGLTAGNSFIYNASIVLNNLPDNYYAHFRVTAESSTEMLEFDDTYVKGVNDTMITLTGRFTVAGITTISVYGLYSFSPLVTTENDTNLGLTSRFVYVRNVSLTLIEFQTIDEQESLTYDDLTITVIGLPPAACVFLRLNGNEATQQLIEGPNPQADVDVTFPQALVQSTPVKPWTITTFTPHGTYLQSVFDITGDGITGDLTFTVNFVLTVSITAGLVLNENCILKLKKIVGTSYDENITFTSTQNLLVDFPTLTTGGAYRLSVQPNASGFINYQIIEASDDPESITADTQTVNLEVAQLFQITVNVPALTNGSLTLQLDFTGETLTFTTGGTKSFPLGVPGATFINIYAINSSNYTITALNGTTPANITFNVALTPLYQFKAFVTGLTTDDATINLKTTDGLTDKLRTYNVIGTTSFTFTVVFSAGTAAGSKYNDVNTTITSSNSPIPGTYVISGGVLGGTIITNDLQFYYDGTAFTVVSGTNAVIRNALTTFTSVAGTIQGSFKIILNTNATAAYNGNTTITANGTLASSSKTWTVLGTALDGLVPGNNLTFTWNGTTAANLAGNLSTITQLIDSANNGTTITFTSFFEANTQVKLSPFDIAKYKTDDALYSIGPSSFNVIQFVPLTQITLTLLNAVKPSAVTLTLSPSVNNQAALTATGNFNIISGQTNLIITFDSADYSGASLGVQTSPTTFQITGLTVSSEITMIAKFSAFLDLTNMTNNSRITFTYLSVLYNIVKITSGSYTFVSPSTALPNKAGETNIFKFPLTINSNDVLPSVALTYFPNQSTTNASPTAALKWDSGNTNVSQDETLEFSLFYYISISDSSTVSLYKNFSTIPLINRLSITTLTVLYPEFLDGELYYLASTSAGIPNYYGLMQNASITLTALTNYTLTTALAGGFLGTGEKVNFRLTVLPENGALNYNSNEALSDQGSFKTLLYGANQYSVGATYISSITTDPLPTVDTVSIFLNVPDDTETATFDVTIPNDMTDYDGTVLITQLTGPTGTYTITGDRLGGLFLINDLTFTISSGGGISNINGSALRIFSNLSFISPSGGATFSVNVSVPIGSLYSSATIVLLSGSYTAGKTDYKINGSFLGGTSGINDLITTSTLTLTVGVQGTVITGTFTGRQPQYFNGIQSGDDTFNLKWTTGTSPIITRSINSSYSGATDKLYTLTNFDDDSHALAFNMKGISDFQTGTSNPGASLLFKKTYNITFTGGNTASVTCNISPADTFTVNSDPFIYNNLKLVQGDNRILTSNDAFLFQSNYSKSLTVATPLGNISITLIPQFQTLTFTRVTPISPTTNQTISLTAIKITDGTNANTGTLTSGSPTTTSSVDRIRTNGSTAETYTYTATVSGATAWSATFTGASTITSFNINLSSLTISSPSTTTDTFLSNTLSLNGVTSSSFALSNGDTIITSTNNLLLSDQSYTLTGTYTSTDPISMLYSVPVPISGTASTFSLNKYDLSITFILPVSQGGIALQLFVSNNTDLGQPFIAYGAVQTANQGGTGILTFSKIPPGCKCKLERSSLGPSGGNSAALFTIIINGTTFTEDRTDTGDFTSYFLTGTPSSIFTMPNNPVVVAVP